MLPSKRLLMGVTVAAALAPASALATTPSSTAPAKAHNTSTLERQLLHSHELWATIDVCDPAKKPNTVGIRGSMPGDGHARDSMYMSFRLQYLDSATKGWINLSSGASSG